MQTNRDRILHFITTVQQNKSRRKTCIQSMNRTTLCNFYKRPLTSTLIPTIIKTSFWQCIINRKNKQSGGIIKKTKGNFKEWTSNDQQGDACWQRQRCEFLPPSETTRSWSVVIFVVVFLVRAMSYWTAPAPSKREVEQQKPKERWVVVEKFPTAAQKAFGPGTPEDREKCLHGSYIDLNVQLSDANLGTTEKLLLREP